MLVRLKKYPWWSIPLASLIILLAGVAAWYFFGGKVYKITRDASKPHSEAVKIWVDQAGIYQVKQAELEKAGFFIDPSELDTLELYTHGVKQPFWIENNERQFSLVFYGQESSSLYSRENVYWLVRGDTLPKRLGWMEMPNNTAPDISDSDNLFGYHVDLEMPAGSIWAAVHLEENKHYQPLVVEGDHWFWESLTAPKSIDFQVDLDVIQGTEGWIGVSVWANTEAPVDPDHRLLINVNDQPVADESWDGKGWHLIQAVLPSGVLKTGGNVIAITAPGVEGVIADIVQLDWIEIHTIHNSVAKADRLVFDGSGEELTMSGFNQQPIFFDITNPWDVTRLDHSFEYRSGSVKFIGENDKRYLVVSPAGYLPAARLEPAVLLPDLRINDVTVDYLVAGPEDLLLPLEPLVTLREGQGYKVLAAPVQAIYDQFNFGMPEPVAVQQMLAYSIENWSGYPAKVLLVGDASYDPKGYITSPEANRLPTFLVQTSYGGETASDVMFLTKNVIDHPDASELEFWDDIAIGRIPAQTSEQVKTYIEKILAYENWIDENKLSRNVIAVADGQGDTFKYDAQQFLDLFPDTIPVDLFAPSPGVTDAGEQVSNFFNQDYLIIAYFGHGSINMWGKDRIFHSEDVLSLKNVNSYPIVINMTCLNGFFIHPKVESIAETLLWHKGGGAIAVLAPTSLTLPTDQSYLSHSLAQSISDGDSKTIGEILAKSRQQIPFNKGGAKDVLLTFLLFGDPAIRLPGE